MHWADVVAKDLLKKGDTHTVATGITPSGQIHVGNMREILTADGIVRATREAGAKVSFIYIGDTFDPLRKVYPFLDSSYKDHIGKPLSSIPCPCDSHKDYAEHFLEPFLESLKRIGVMVEPILTHEMYRSGEYAESVRRVIMQMDTIKEIITRISGRELPADWYPYNPVCSSCGTIVNAKGLGFEDPFVLYRCSCGHEGKADITKGEGKLPWRIDWPARWSFLGVTCEPFGKDHATAGGSYQTGEEIAKNIFEMEAPHPVVYEWIQLKGKGAMSSSTGVVVSAVDMLQMTPPEVLRFLVMKVNPNKHIDFDPGLGILDLIDRYDHYEQVYFDAKEGFDTQEEKRVYELSQIRGVPGQIPLQVPYRHLTTLVQIEPDIAKMIDKLKRSALISDLDESDRKRLEGRVACARYWVKNSAPEGVRFSLIDEPPSEISKEKDGKIGSFFKKLGENLKESDWSATEIHNHIHESAQSCDLSSKEAFRSLYGIFIGKAKGPRLGFFLASLDQDFVLKRLKDA